MNNILNEENLILKINFCTFFYTFTNLFDVSLNGIQSASHIFLQFVGICCFGYKHMKKFHLHVDVALANGGIF